MTEKRGNYLSEWVCDSCAAVHGYPPKQLEQLSMVLPADDSDTDSDASDDSDGEDDDDDDDDNGDDGHDRQASKKRKSLSSSASSAPRKAARSGKQRGVVPQVLDADAVQKRDEARARVRERLAEVLHSAITEAAFAAIETAAAGGAVGGAVLDSDVQNVATAVEACLFEQAHRQTDNSYVGKARSLLFNLKTIDNAPLRVSLVRGQITPRQLCNMSPKVSVFFFFFSFLLTRVALQDMAPAHLAETIKRFEQKSMSENVITAEVAAEKFKKTDAAAHQKSVSQSQSNAADDRAGGGGGGGGGGDASGSERDNGDAPLRASAGGDRAPSPANGGGGDGDVGGSGSPGAGDSVARLSTAALFQGAIKSFSDFADDDDVHTFDEDDDDDVDAALLDPEALRRVPEKKAVQPYTPPGTPPPLSDDDDDAGAGGVGGGTDDHQRAPSMTAPTFAPTSLFGVKIDMDQLRADGMLTCRGSLPPTVARAFESKMSIVGRMEADKCDAYLGALSSSSSRDRVLCYVAAASADSREKLSRLSAALRERNRVGVVKCAKTNTSLRECFLFPWDGATVSPFLAHYTALLPPPTDYAPLLAVFVLTKVRGNMGVGDGFLNGASVDSLHRAPLPPPPPQQQQLHHQQPQHQPHHLTHQHQQQPQQQPPPSHPSLLRSGGSDLSSALSSLAAVLSVAGGGSSLLSMLPAQQAQAQPQPHLQQPAMPMQQQSTFGSMDPRVSAYAAMMPRVDPRTGQPVMPMQRPQPTQQQFWGGGNGGF